MEVATRPSFVCSMGLLRLRSYCETLCDLVHFLNWFQWRKNNKKIFATTLTSLRRFISQLMATLFFFKNNELKNIQFSRWVVGHFLFFLLLVASGWGDVERGVACIPQLKKRNKEKKRKEKISLCRFPRHRGMTCVHAIYQLKEPTLDWKKKKTRKKEGKDNKSSLLIVKRFKQPWNLHTHTTHVWKEGEGVVAVCIPLCEKRQHKRLTRLYKKKNYCLREKKGRPAHQRRKKSGAAAAAAVVAAFFFLDCFPLYFYFFLS